MLQNKQKLLQITSDIIKKLVSEGASINEMEYVLDEAKFQIKDLIPSFNKSI